MIRIIKNDTRPLYIVQKQGTRKLLGNPQRQAGIDKDNWLKKRVKSGGVKMKDQGKD